MKKYNNGFAYINDVMSKIFKGKKIEVQSIYGKTEKQIIQIIQKDKNTVLGLATDGRVYISKGEGNIWELYIEKTYMDSEGNIHYDNFEDENNELA